jgi:ABC-2 type transport system ATP-binding protein
MSTPLLRVEAVNKTFVGRAAVDTLSFEVREGEVFALLGPNGAGKTTTVRMLVGIIRPDTGSIAFTVNGTSAATMPPEQTGYLPEERGLYREISVQRTLVYFGMLRGMDRHAAAGQAAEWLEKMGLSDRRDERLDALSKGNQQRVQLIAAVLHRPRLAILDEPFTGLDPLSQEFFLDLVRELKAAGTTIILSAHQMDLVERSADRVLLMNRGREILSGSVHEMHERLDARPRLRLTLEAGTDGSLLKSDPDIDELRMDGDDAHVTLHARGSIPAFLARVMSRLPVQSVATETPRLHDVFVRAVREDDARAAGAAP